MSALLGQVQGLLRRPFVRNVGTVATGTVLAQAITLGSAPFITRLYGPEAYGLQGLFISMLSVLTVISTLGYSSAIVLPRSAAEARALVRLCLGVALAMFLFVGSLVALAGDEFLALFNAQALGPYAWLLPLAMLVAALGAILGQWLIRHKAFQLTSRIAVFRASVTGLSKIGFGLVLPSAIVLIGMNVVGAVAASLLGLLLWRFSKATTMREAGDTAGDTRLGSLARRYADFPTLRTPQTLINTISQVLPVLLLASYFGVASAGQYSLAIAVLALPTWMIGGSVMSVFYPRVNEAVLGGENVKRLLTQATLVMAAIGVVPFALVMFLGPLLFAFVFGADFETAGVYAQWLSVWIFLQFVNKPAVAAVAPLRLQRGLLIYEVFSTGTKVLALWLGFALFNSDEMAIALFAGFGIIAYLWLIGWVIHRSGQEHITAAGRAGR